MTSTKKCLNQHITYPLGSMLTWAFLFACCLLLQKPCLLPKNSASTIMIITSFPPWKPLPVLVSNRDALFKHEDLIDSHGHPYSSGECNNNNNCTTTPNNDNQLDNDGGEDVAMHDNLVDGHGHPCSSDKHNNNNNCTTTPNNDNHLDKAALTMTTIDPVVCTQQSTNDESK